MIWLDCEPDSPEWVAARIGIPTASCYDQIVTAAKLEPSKASDKYLDGLLAEWVLGQAIDDFAGTFWTDRGQAFEPEARAYFEATTDLEVSRGGFCLRDDARMTGCSPDGLIWGDAASRGRPPIAGLELKCPKLSTHLGYWRRGELPRQYRMQVQGSMWVTGAERWYFMSYHPGVPPLLVTVERDEAVMAALDEHVPAFIARLVAARDRLLDEGVEPAATMWEAA